MNEAPNRDVEVFTAALQWPAGERAAFLERACGGDQELRHRVEALLKTHDRLGDFLEQPPTESTRSRPGVPSGELPGDRIGRYKLLQPIGEGGCGVVYMAEQEEPVRRRVALKIIKPGMDTKSVIARFEAERQALALMDHPNIAKVFDAGATESGRPFFVMELVRGIKITDYCDQNSLTTEERLNLFIQVCQAVQHAHQKGIIHRDIKPSNILVTTSEEGAALPVVIDFGIAKATTNLQLTDKTFFTAFEMLIGTPAYMSPEQAACTSVDADTRTDIYSLGVLLYELLTGATPFDTSTLMKAGLDEIRRVIREEEPVRPSTKLTKMTGADLTTVARQRNSEPPKLIRSITGDLDWIAMKALEKDRTRRYETANGLALDVRRYLANETIAARPPSKLYKLKKMALRNRLLFLGSGVIASLLVVSLIMVSASLGRERQARREADIGRHKAQTEAAKSRQVTLFLEDMLQGAGPSVALGRDATMLREILDRTAARVGMEMTNQPAVEAELRSVMGRVYFEIGIYDQAEAMHRAALAIHRKLFGPESREVAASLNRMGLALDKRGRAAEAENPLREAVDIRRRLFGNENADVATSLNDLATVLRHQKKLAEAEALTRESLAIRQRLFGKDSLEVADTLHNLTVVLGDEGKRAECEATAREMLEMRRRLLGDEHPLVAAALADVAKLDEAESAGEKALVMQRKLLGDEHPEVARSLNLLGQLLKKQDHLPESHAVLKAALSIQRKVLGEDHLDVLYTLRSLSWTLEAEGKLAEAETAQRGVLALWRKRGEGESPQAMSQLESLTRILIAQKKFAEAEQLLNEPLPPAFLQQPASAKLLTLRFDLKVRSGKWPEAATDAALAFEHQPSNHDRFSALAALLIKSGNRPAYEKLRTRLLATSGSTSNIFVADQVAKACLLLPPSEAELRVIGPLTELTMTRGAREAGALPFFQVCKALFEYREGHYSEAIEWARKPVQSANVQAHGQAYAIMAMAHWQRGEKTAARERLAQGEVQAPPTLPVQIAESRGNAWLGWLLARIQLDEAAALIRE
jgi:serine/threonine protein kinase